MRGLFAAMALCTACSSGPWIVVTVRSNNGSSLPAATVSAVCEPTGSAAKVTDGDGVARLDLRYGNDPKRCVVTVAHAEHLTQQSKVTTLCKALTTCPAIDVELERE